MSETSVVLPVLLDERRLTGPFSFDETAGFVIAERERVMAEMRALYLKDIAELHRALWPSESDYVAAGGYKNAT